MKPISPNQKSYEKKLEQLQKFEGLINDLLTYLKPYPYDYVTLKHALKDVKEKNNKNIKTIESTLDRL